MSNNKRDIYTNNNITNPDDLKTRIINIDSRFREKDASGNDAPGTSSANFTYVFDYITQLRNVIFMRIASVEIPNMWYNFSAEQKNTSFDISTNDCSNNKINENIIIPDGIYTTEDLINVIHVELKSKVDISCTVSFNMTTVRMDFCYCKPFEINFGSTEGINFERTLGYRLGFRQSDSSTVFTSRPDPNITGSQILTSSAAIDVIGNSYILLGIDGFYAVEQRLLNYNNPKDPKGILYCAKIIVREEKGSVIYDDGSSLISSNIIPKLPIHIPKFKIKLMDSYGDVLNLNGLDFSFTIEILELTNITKFS